MKVRYHECQEGNQSKCASINQSINQSIALIFQKESGTINESMNQSIGAVHQSTSERAVIDDGVGLCVRLSHLPLRGEPVTHQRRLDSRSLHARAA